VEEMVPFATTIESIQANLGSKNYSWVFFPYESWI